MKITDTQRNAASSYWTQVLTGELKPNLQLIRKEGLPSFMASMELIHRSDRLEKLALENPRWPLIFMNKLDELLKDADVSLVLRYEYHPEGLLQQAAKEAGIQEDLFPIGKLIMSFDEENHIIVNDKKIGAARFIKNAAKQMTL